jgi:hypothetical protein
MDYMKKILIFLSFFYSCNVAILHASSQFKTSKESVAQASTSSASEHTSSASSSSMVGATAQISAKAPSFQKVDPDSQSKEKASSTQKNDDTAVKIDLLSTFKSEGLFSHILITPNGQRIAVNNTTSDNLPLSTMYDSNGRQIRKSITSSLSFISNNIAITTRANHSKVFNAIDGTRIASIPGFVKAYDLTNQRFIKRDGKRITIGNMQNPQTNIHIDFASVSHQLCYLLTSPNYCKGLFYERCRELDDYCSYFGLLRLYDLTTGKCIKIFAFESTVIGGFSCDSTRIVLHNSVPYDTATTELIDTQTGNKIGETLRGFNAAMFSPTQPLVALTNASEIHIFTTDKFQKVTTFPGSHCVFSKDGKTIAILKKESQRSWNVTTYDTTTWSVITQSCNFDSNRIPVFCNDLIYAVVVDKDYNIVIYDLYSEKKVAMISEALLKEKGLEFEKINIEFKDPLLLVKSLDISNYAFPRIDALLIFKFAPQMEYVKKTNMYSLQFAGKPNIQELLGDYIVGPLEKPLTTTQKEAQKEKAEDEKAAKELEANREKLEEQQKNAPLAQEQLFKAINTNDNAQEVKKLLNNYTINALNKDYETILEHAIRHDAPNIVTVIINHEEIIHTHINALPTIVHFNLKDFGVNAVYLAVEQADDISARGKKKFEMAHEIAAKMEKAWLTKTTRSGKLLSDLVRTQLEIFPHNEHLKELAEMMK